VLLRLLTLHQLESGGSGLVGGAFLVLHDGRGNFWSGLRGQGQEALGEELRE
jgi:hypothetical protein